MHLQLETTGFCDAACVFCPYPTTKRAKGVMSMDLFMRIIDETVHLPRIDHLTFTGLSETLLDKFLLDRIRYARQKLRSMRIDIYTNGSQLTTEKIDALIAAGLSEMYISLNATNKESRQQIMYPHKPDYFDYDRVCEMADYAIAKGKGKMKTYVKAIVAKDLMEGGEQEAFMERWHGPYQEGGNAFMHLEGNWAGAIYPMRVKPKTPCFRALEQLMVLWDGRMSLCCFDSQGDVILGDLNQQTIKEIFNGERATAVRLAHWEGRRSEIPICANCTSI